jgi:hypothetical protein
MADPDFDRLADVCLSRVYDARGDGLLAEHGHVVEALRQVWNARGDADLEQLQQVATYAPFDAVTRIIKAVDR